MTRSRGRSCAEGESIPILYGGSVSEDGAAAILEQPGVVRLFVGRRALDLHAFAAIARTPVRRPSSP